MVEDVPRGWPLFVDADVNGAGERAEFALPTGTVTFLLSDVEGSTRRWETIPEAMAVAIPRHYEILAAAIEANSGVRPVEQGEGDSVVGAFSRATDAVTAALTIQREMAAAEWPPDAELRVRIAINTGEAQLRDQGNYVGMALNRCARIRGTGYGGQILLSSTTVALVRDRLPAGATIEDLGQHRLKDLGRPEQIFQLVHPDLADGFPPLKSLDTFHHNLPIQLTPLIGRTREIAVVNGLAATERLVTLTGSGGVGKTRLALAVAAEAVDSHPGGVFWVELAALADPSTVGRAALVAAGGRDAPGSPIAEQLAAQLGNEASLLVLDNCEHVLEACAELVTGLLSIHPSVSVLTTSREPLGVPGEVTWRVPSMGCPAPAAKVDVPSLSQYDAVALFIERAHRARPSFAVTDANAPAIAQICHRLDGIPLALELAAARCRQLSPERIATELDNRFRLLTGGARTVMARQQTLLASLEWSHERLADAERAAFRRLGAFAGPFPLEAAEAVVASVGDTDPLEVFDLVTRLVDKSLVVVDDHPTGELRYRLLETLRAYALDRARASGELATIRDAHAAWWAEWLEPRGALPTDDALAVIEEFHANLVNALEWSLENPPVGLRLLIGLGRPWDALGRGPDAMAAVARLLSEDPAPELAPLWLDATGRVLELVFQTDGPEAAFELRDRLATVAAAYGDEFALARVGMELDQPGAAATLQARARERGDVYAELHAAGFEVYFHAEHEPRLALEPLARFEQLLTRYPVAESRDALDGIRAGLAIVHGDLASGVEHCRALLTKPHTASWGDAVRLASYAGLLARDHDVMALTQATVERAQAVTPGLTGWVHNVNHRAALLQGAPSEIDAFMLDPTLVAPPPTPPTYWLTGREAIDAGGAEICLSWARRRWRESPHFDALLAALDGAAGGGEDRWHDALALAVEHGFRLVAVDALEGLATGAARSESWTEALRLLGAAGRLRDETGYVWRFGFEQRAYDAALAAARTGAGDATDEALAEGAALDLRAAAEYARRARGERKRPQHGWASLTPTEHQVATLVSDGLTNPQIAERLLMGRETVKTHLDHVFTKLGMRTRAELAAEVARRALSR